MDFRFYFLYVARDDSCCFVIWSDLSSATRRDIKTNNNLSSRYTVIAQLEVVRHIDPDLDGGYVNAIAANPCFYLSHV